MGEGEGVHRLAVLFEGLVIDLTICLIFYLHYYGFCYDSRADVELQQRLVQLLAMFRL